MAHNLSRDVVERTLAMRAGNNYIVEPYIVEPLVTPFTSQNHVSYGLIVYNDCIFRYTMLTTVYIYLVTWIMTLISLLFP